MGVSLLDQLQAELPIRLVPYCVAEAETGLVILDAITAFCAVGAGPLAPVAPDARIGAAVRETDGLARRFVERRWPVLVFVGTRLPDGPHGNRAGLVPELAWLEDEPDATVLRKDCVDAFVGAIEPVHHGTHGTSRNRAVDWVNAHRLASVLVTGVCTDTGVMDFVLSMLSARNHGMMPTLKDVVVLEPATATCRLPREAAGNPGLPETATHPKPATHHMGLYFMASRGAVLADRVTGL
jgi:nicotinamidase-related amidase